MRINYEINSRRPGRSIAITIDLLTFSIPRPDTHLQLALSHEQLEFAHLQTLPAYIEGSTTTLYYPFGAIRVKGHVLRSTTQLLQQNIPWTGLSLREEDSLVSISPVNYDLRPLSPIKPLGRVVTLAAKHQIIPPESLQEIVQVHIIPESNHKLLQYRYSANNAYGLIARLAKLESFAGENAMIVGNVSLRTFF